MKIAAFDVGSNSVRLLLAKDGVKVLKTSKVTKLAENLDANGILSDNAVERTLCALLSFYRKAADFGATEFYAFATEAMRKAKNPESLIAPFKRETGVTISVISGEKEADLGLKGALKGKDGGLIDLGGASLELTVQKGGEVVYTKSLPIGIVRVKNFIESGRGDVKDYIREILKGFSDAPETDEFTMIGGTATHLCAIDSGLSPYDPDKVNGYVLTKEKLDEFADTFSKLTVSEIANLKGATADRADTVYGGALVLSLLCETLKIRKATVSEDDNLDGFLYYLTEDNK